MRVPLEVQGLGQENWSHLVHLV